MEGLRDQERSAQDSLNFTQHTNRIEYLSSQTLLHLQEENYQKVRVQSGAAPRKAYCIATQRQRCPDVRTSTIIMTAAYFKMSA